MRILVSITRMRKYVNRRRKIILASILTVALSSFFYTSYVARIVENRIVNREIRERISKKTQGSNQLAYGMRCTDLSQEEYRFISERNWFLTISDKASNISYNYSYDGFLPDYSFELTYSLPLGSKIDTIYFKDQDFSKRQSVRTLKDRIEVSYIEIEM